MTGENLDEKEKIKRAAYATIFNATPEWANRLINRVNDLATKVEVQSLEIKKLSLKADVMAEGIEFIKNCHMHPDTRGKLDKILNREGVEL